MPSNKIKVPLGPVTRVRAKRLREAFQGLVREVQSQEVVPKVIEGLEHDDLKLIYLVQVKEGHEGPSPS